MLVTFSDLQEYCLKYDSERNLCELCYQGFWDDIVEACLPPLKKIDKAIFYLDDYNIQQCQDGYGYSANRKECLAIDSKYIGCVRGNFDAKLNFYCT